MKKMRIILPFLMLLQLLGCSAFAPSTQTIHGLSEQELYQNGMNAMANHHYFSALRFFESLESNYPFAKNIETARINLVYAYYKAYKAYKADDYGSAIAAADRFIHTYPADKHLDYVYYIKGLANFHQDRGLFLRMLPINLAHRDPGTMQEAFKDFKTLVTRFPHSQYAPDARQRMVYLRDLFARRELHVAQFYLNRGAYVAAIDRSEYIIKHYQHAPQNLDALVVMVKSYRKLGLKQQANDALEILKLNAAGSSQYKSVS